MSQKLSRPFAKALALSCLFAFVACDEMDSSPTAPDDVSIDGLDPSFYGERSNRSKSPVLAYPDGMEPLGWSYLIRRPNAVQYKVKTAGLNPGHAYTLWMVIFNNPGACTSGPEPSPDSHATQCGDFDLFNPDAKPDLVWAGGRIARKSGEVTFRGRRRVGSSRGSVNAPVGAPSYGLLDSKGADIRFVVHHHGPADAKYMPDMIRSIDGGCRDAGVPAEGVASPYNLYDGPPSLPGYGRRGSNTCESVQFAVHFP